MQATARRLFVMAATPNVLCRRSGMLAPQFSALLEEVSHRNIFSQIGSTRQDKWCGPAGFYVARPRPAVRHGSNPRLSPRWRRPPMIFGWPSKLRPNRQTHFALSAGRSVHAHSRSPLWFPVPSRVVTLGCSSRGRRARTPTTHTNSS